MYHASHFLDSIIISIPDGEPTICLVFMGQRFVAVMDGPEERIIPGNALAISANLPFRGLDRFGVSFLNKFEVCTVHDREILLTVVYIHRERETAMAPHSNLCTCLLAQCACLSWWWWWVSS